MIMIKHMKSILKKIKIIIVNLLINNSIKKTIIITIIII